MPGFTLSSGYCLCGFTLGFEVSSKKHAGAWSGMNKDMNECVKLCNRLGSPTLGLRTTGSQVINKDKAVTKDE